MADPRFPRLQNCAERKHSLGLRCPVTRNTGKGYRNNKQRTTSVSKRSAQNPAKKRYEVNCRSLDSHPPSQHAFLKAHEQLQEHTTKKQSGLSFAYEQCLYMQICVLHREFVSNIVNGHSDKVQACTIAIEPACSMNIVCVCTCLRGCLCERSCSFLRALVFCLSAHP